LVKILNIDRLEVPVDVNDNSYGDGCLGGGNGNYNQAEKMTMQLIRIEKPVEDHEINIDRIENQLNRHQHGDQISSCQETIDAYEEHQGTDYKKGIEWDIIYHDFVELAGFRDFSFLASTIAPTIAASNRTEITSKGRAKPSRPVETNARPTLVTLESSAGAVVDTKANLKIVKSVSTAPAATARAEKICCLTGATTAFSLT
jgi:hypothetical protein